MKYEINLNTKDIQDLRALGTQHPVAKRITKQIRKEELEAEWAALETKISSVAKAELVDVMRVVYWGDSWTVMTPISKSIENMVGASAYRLLIQMSEKDQ